MVYINGLNGLQTWVRVSMEMVSVARKINTIENSASKLINKDSLLISYPEYDMRLIQLDDSICSSVRLFNDH
jgi:hypothetical protein